MDQAEIATRLAVLDLYGQYARRVDHGDPDAYGALFTADGVLEVGDTRAVGPEQNGALMRSFFEALPDSFHPYRHHLTSALIEITGPDTVTASTYFACITPAGLDNWGVYSDEIRNCDGHWLFARRVVTVEGAVPASPFAPIIGLTPEATQPTWAAR